MKELYIFCEGKTERVFCDKVLRPHLFPHHDGLLHTTQIIHSKHHGVVTRGGIGSYAALERGIRNVLKGRDGADVSFTTMIDLYKLPKDFPGKADRDLDPVNPMPYVEALERAFEEAIEDRRFIPYIQLYEYETLLFSDPECFRISFDDCDAAVASLQGIVASYRSIEHINDGEATVPSKRIIALLPEYHGRKVDAGPDIAEYIGLATLRRKCPHFDGWLNRLESR